MTIVNQSDKMYIDQTKKEHKLTDLLINRMPAREVTKLINESRIVISRQERYDENSGYGPVGEVYWLVRDEKDNLACSDPFYRLWEARECAIQWVMEINEDRR